jgi:hypothetical protein
MEQDIDFKRIRVPIVWAGRQRELSDGSKVWACGACAYPDDCACEGRCDRASDEDLARGLT